MKATHVRLILRGQDQAVVRDDGEEVGVVSHDVFQRLGGVVVEIGSGVADAAQLRNLERVEVAECGIVRQ